MEGPGLKLVKFTPAACPIVRGSKGNYLFDEGFGRAQVTRVNLGNA
jgi:hypothetical protein